MANVLVAYLFWITGGFFGLHHFYIGRHALLRQFEHSMHGQSFLCRDLQGCLWLTSGGGFFWGCFRDMFRMEDYVNAANASAEYTEVCKCIVHSKKVL